MSPADEANEHLVDAAILQGALWSRPVIAAFRKTPRHRFLERVFVPVGEGWREVVIAPLGPDEIRLAYQDRALITHLGTLGERRVPVSSSSQPTLMAQMLEDLHLRPGLRTLEVGAGTRYNAALIALLVGAGGGGALGGGAAGVAEAGRAPGGLS